MNSLSGATLLITGGTGSFGSTVLKHFLTSDIGQIRIFSRDEKKQDDMRHHLQARYPEHADKVRFYIGDVRDLRSVADAMPGVDYIFHAAALKQVPSCEFFPIQAVRTNVEGTDNVLHAAIDARVRRVVCLSQANVSHTNTVKEARFLLGLESGIVTYLTGKLFCPLPCDFGLKTIGHKTFG